jgi:hypothetical protein
LAGDGGRGNSGLLGDGFGGGLQSIILIPCNSAREGYLGEVGIILIPTCAPCTRAKATALSGKLLLLQFATPTLAPAREGPRNNWIILIQLFSAPLHPPAKGYP